MKEVVRDEKTEQELYKVFLKLFSTKRELKLWVAEDVDTPASILRELSKEEDKEIFLAVASNPNTPEETIMDMLKTKKRAVEKGQNLPAEVFKELSESEYIIIRESVATNPIFSKIPNNFSESFAFI